MHLLEDKRIRTKDGFPILLVDDESESLAMMGQIIKRSGYSFDSALNCRRALELLSNSVFELVICDMALPDGDGILIAQSAIARNADTLVIFVTGYSREEAITRIAMNRPFGFLQKPVPSSALTALVDEAYANFCRRTEHEELDAGRDRTIALQQRELEFTSERLMAETELVRNLIAQANFGLVALDINGVVHVSNDQVWRLLGGETIEGQSYLGSSLSEVLQDPALSLLQELCQLVGSGASRLEERKVGYTKPNRALELIAYPVFHRAVVSGIVVVVSDVTEREQLQERLVHTSKLASIGELAAGIAHEINNPLGFITSNCGTLRDYVSKLISYTAFLEKEIASADGSAGQREAIETCRTTHDIEYIKSDGPALLKETMEGLRRVSKIIQDLKVFARKGEVQAEKKQVNDLIMDALNLVRNSLKYAFDVETELGELPTIQCFPSQLVQVFTNMFVNAVQAADKSRRGKLTIRTTRTATGIMIAISDNGMGIRPEILSKIFDPFFTTKKPGEGTGMGLSISYGIIRRHGGDINVSSELEKGTEFVIKLPTSLPDTDEA